ncbi:hypothetical protein BGZ63DRAFT_200058 [Mariannaea sp. PMI_226]|nr:hypothetical protein BGZ63DRAFT_200058 [Mariannaea sp. PMI_226]
MGVVQSTPSDKELSAAQMLYVVVCCVVGKLHRFVLRMYCACNVPWYIVLSMKQGLWSRGTVVLGTCFPYLCAGMAQLAGEQPGCRGCWSSSTHTHTQSQKIPYTGHQA